jgi:hypothetical protein
MNEITAWMQSNWYELGTLVAEFAFVAAAIWFARKILRTLRASQEQVGALLKLSVTGGAADRQSPNAAADRPSIAAASPYWLTPSETASAGSPEQAESAPHLMATHKNGLIVWLQTPMSSGGVAPWRKAIRWLQSPAGS